MFSEDRGIGITELLHGAAEDPIIVLFAVITQLGDGWFLFLLGGSLYVAGNALPRSGIDRRRGLFVLALALTYVALIGVIKAVFQLTRPPEASTSPELVEVPPFVVDLVNDVAAAGGLDFPSGHALGSTMVWGGLALVLQWGSFRTRSGIATGIILLVSLSRLVLGVHYVVDVIVGMGLGVVVLGALYWLVNSGTAPGRVLVVAIIVGVPDLLTGVTFDSIAAIGGAVGGWLVWRGIADRRPPSRRPGSRCSQAF